MLQRIRRAWFIWTPIVLAAIGVVANFQGFLDFMQRYVWPLLAREVYLGPALMLLVAVSLAAFGVGRRVGKQVPRPDVASILTEGQFLERFHIFLVSARDCIRVVGLTKDWIFPLVLSVFAARRRGVKIEVMCIDGTHERYRLLEYLGCTVHRVASVPVSGVLSDAGDILHSRVAMECPRRQRENIFGRYYYGSLDWHAINSVDTRFSAAIPTTDRALAVGDAYVPDLVEVQDDLLVERLSRVRAYDGSKIALEDVAIGTLFPVSTQVLKYKLLQVEHLLHMYQSRGWSLFRSCGIELKNGEISLLVPPVIEEHDGKLCIAEGHTRLYRLRQKGVTTVRVAVVRSVAQRLPMPPGKWSDVEVTDDKTERRDAQFARYIETTTHKNIWLETPPANSR